jgi:hypothetical protein
MSARDLAVVPFFAGVAGFGLLFGTVVDQPARHNSDNDVYNPMAGMNMGSGSGSGATTSMPGMNMGSNAAPAGGGTMTMSDGSTMAAAAMPEKSMDMSDPKMAAAMPGGLHTTCSGQECTVIFAPTSTGVANILGTTAKLDSATGKQIELTVGKKKLTLRQGKPVTDGKFRVELVASDSHQYTVKFTKRH